MFVAVSLSKDKILMTPFLEINSGLLIYMTVWYENIIAAKFMNTYSVCIETIMNIEVAPSQFMLL